MSLSQYICSSEGGEGSGVSQVVVLPDCVVCMVGKWHAGVVHIIELSLLHCLVSIRGFISIHVFVIGNFFTCHFYVCFLEREIKIVYNGHAVVFPSF